MRQPGGDTLKALEALQGLLGLRACLLTLAAQARDGAHRGGGIEGNLLAIGVKIDRLAVLQHGVALFVEFQLHGRVLLGMVERDA